MARLFISYARLDGSELAERLEADLQNSNQDPWRDRSEIQAGIDWARQIEGAIDRCDALIAVLTVGAYHSEICRGEHGRALRKGKRVIPLLAQTDADRPVYLEMKHYIDFTDPDQYDLRFTDLLTNIKMSGGVTWNELSPRFRAQLGGETPISPHGALLRNRQAKWSEIYELAVTQRKRYLEALAPRSGTIGVYESGLYTRRTEAENEFDAFIKGQAYALLLIGETGMGKTNLLCKWSGQQSNAGNAVMMFHCDRLGTKSVERELLTNFGMEDLGTLAQVLADLETTSSNSERLLILIFDGINEYRGSAQELLIEIDSLVAKLPGKHLRIILSCSSATWSRLDRIGPVQLTWDHYHRARNDEAYVVLKKFNEEETTAAFDLYQRFFKLKFTRSDLPFALRTRLREPLLLRLLAETYQTLPDRSAVPTFDTLVFARYYDERVRRRDDRFLIDELVEEMAAQQSSALSIDSLSRHPALGPAVLSEAADSSYNRMLDLGVLLEMQGDLFHDAVVKFTYPLVGAYTLARRLSREKQPLGRAIRDLVEQTERFPFAWDAAVTLLMMRGDFELYAELAATPNPEERELVSESLVRLQDADRDRAEEILKGLLDSEQEQQQRTALRAAFSIGPDARELLLSGAMSKSQSLQQAVKDTLFLIWSGTSGTRGRVSTSTVYFLWRHEQDFTHQMMRDLVARVSWRRLPEATRIIRFILDWCITLYINHCDRADVAQQVAELFHELIVGRLHLDRMNFGSHFDQVVLRIVASVFSRPIMEWTLMEDPEHFFQRPESEKNLLTEAESLVDPAADIIAAEDLMRRMLDSNAAALRGTATLILAIHSYADFTRSEGLHRRLFAALDADGQFWQLIGFSVLLPDTPVLWVDLLEDMTQQIFESTGQPFSEDTEQLKKSDLLFVPLGLAYGKLGQGMPYFEQLLASALSQDRHEIAARVVANLGPIGFYYPRIVLAVLQPYLQGLLSQPDTLEALANSLATIRTLHFDLVDTFIFRAGLDESFYRKVAVTMDVKLTNRFMLTLGLYNNAVHQCLHYPRMRRWLTQFPLERLAQVDSAGDFVTDYATKILRMAREANFNLLEFTLPE